jgi:hypothetical protein
MRKSVSLKGVDENDWYETTASVTPATTPEVAAAGKSVLSESNFMNTV